MEAGGPKWAEGPTIPVLKAHAIVFRYGLAYAGAYLDRMDET